MIRLFPRDSVSLVLDAGATYHYLVKQNQRKAQISVRTWRDTKCSASDVLSGLGSGSSISGGAGPGGGGGRSPWTPLSQNVTVVCLPTTAPIPTTMTTTTTTLPAAAWLDN
ncbi:hypothetical protein DFP72DRAFT_865247 [Ephemerocybe angulata]|uniref:Uncharacterized protein n=1 Tax=Ephemerocybe angulata TaxID=980116 RepID=A0A8H6IK79_9AGAR|nr:hypothetical protein DFP72DRAFT_865247 [Tulosesus angulatus]